MEENQICKGVDRYRYLDQQDDLKDVQLHNLQKNIFTSTCLTLRLKF